MKAMNGFRLVRLTGSLEDQLRELDWHVAQVRGQMCREPEPPPPSLYPSLPRQLAFWEGMREEVLGALALQAGLLDRATTCALPIVATVAEPVPKTRVRQSV